MNRLVSVIGQAPSELSFEGLLSRLRKERERVMISIKLFREGYSLKGPAKKRSPGVVKRRAVVKQVLSQQAEKHGMSQEELMKLIEEEG